MKNKNIGIGFALVLLAGILGTAFFVWEKPSEENKVLNGGEGEVVEPLTLEEAQNLEIDTSDWKTYTSEDGVLEFKYPERIETVFQMNLVDAPTVSSLGSKDGVDLSGKYLSNESAMRLRSTAFGPDMLTQHAESSMRVFVIVFAEDITKSDIQNYLVSAGILIDDFATVTIGSRTYDVSKVYGETGSEKRKIYTSEFPNGQTLYLEARLFIYDNNPEEIHVALADRVVSEILESMQAR